MDYESKVHDIDSIRELGIHDDDDYDDRDDFNNNNNDDDGDSSDDGDNNENNRGNHVHIEEGCVDNVEKGNFSDYVHRKDVGSKRTANPIHPIRDAPLSSTEESRVPLPGK